MSAGRHGCRDFDGIDPSLFVDADGSAWLVNNGPPEGAPRYEGHRAIWIQRFDLKAGALVGPRKVIVDGGVRPQEQPVWAEGPPLHQIEDRKSVGMGKSLYGMIDSVGGRLI